MPAQPGEIVPGRAARRRVPRRLREAVRASRPAARAVDSVHRDGARLRVETDSGSWHARAVISATGTWTRPFLPAVPGRRDYPGRQLHTVQYRSPADFAGRRVIVVGGGNSGAQIAADLAGTARPDLGHPAPAPLPAPTTSTAARSSTPRPPAAAPSTRAALTPAASPRSATSSPSRPYARARDAGLLDRHADVRRLTADGVDWADGTSARGRRDHLVHRLPPGPRTLRLAPPARHPRPHRHRRHPRRRTNPACTCSATATGPARPPPPSSASAAPPAKPPARSRTCLRA